MIIVNLVRGKFKENTKLKLIRRRVDWKYLDMYAHLQTFQSDNFHGLVVKPHTADSFRSN